MSQENNSTIALGNENRSNKTLQMVLVAVMAALICVVAPFSIPLPFTAVPISFTNFMIYLAIFALGWKRASISYVLYMCIGAFGLPVFSGFTGGPAKIVGPTGGYLLGFLFIAIVSGIIVDKVWDSNQSKVVKIVLYAFGFLLSLAICYAFGTVWFMLQQNIPFAAASVNSTLAACVYPFLPGDIMKIVIAIVVGIPLRVSLRKNHLV